MDTVAAGHLWDVDHPYYCEESNFYKAGLVGEFASWQTFIDECEHDVDLNLLFRWDWTQFEDEGDTLRLHFMTQRKGAYRSAIVSVTKDNERAVREYLAERWAHMMTLWAPLSDASVAAS